jgi:phytoene dehydrogenase-like protein
MELARAGHAVTVYEAARTGGGARRVERENTVLDNGSTSCWAPTRKPCA